MRSVSVAISAVVNGLGTKLNAKFTSISTQLKYAYLETRSEKPSKINGRRFIHPDAQAAHGNSVVQPKHISSQKLHRDFNNIRVRSFILIGAPECRRHETITL